MSNPLISIITPLHEPGNGYIEKAWRTLNKQTYQNFEWVILENNGGSARKLPEDNRIKIFVEDQRTSNIGLLKKKCSMLSAGDYILELDADDTLEKSALEKIVQAFENPEVMFVFSDCLEIEEDGSLKTFSPYWGWKHNDIIIDGESHKYNATFPVSPHSLRQIFWAPNHLRAWRSTAYNELGMHNQNLNVGDDHELLVRFYAKYGEKGFYHIEEPLYNYYLHNKNTFKEKADIIAEQSWENYYNYKEAMVLRWAQDKNLLAIDLGGGLYPQEGYKTADIRITADYNLNLNDKWVWEENSVGVFRASDTLEHLYNPINTMNKAYKALAPGGWFFIAVPSTDGRGAFQDPTHVSFWNENSFWYYTDPKYATFIPDFIGKFQVAQLRTIYPSEWHKNNNIPYVYADLIAVKDGYHPIGECLWRNYE